LLKSASKTEVDFLLALLISLATFLEKPRALSELLKVTMPQDGEPAVLNGTPFPVAETECNSPAPNRSLLKTN